MWDRVVVGTILPNHETCLGIPGRLFQRTWDRQIETL